MDRDELRKLDERIAVEVMGWTPRGEDHLWTAPDGRKYIKHPYYSTDCADSKQVREKLAERFATMTMERCAGSVYFGVYSPDSDVGSLNDNADSFGEYAETEELAVALCALKSLSPEGAG